MVVQARAAQPLTLEAFLARPETKPYREFAQGEAFRKPLPDMPHSFLQSWLVLLFVQYLAANPIGRAGTELRCIFGPPDDVRAYVPDVVFISHARVPPGPVQEGDYPWTAPDLAVEVLSRRQNQRRLAEKLRFYLAYGVRLVWLVDPRTRTITVHAPGVAPVTLRAGDTLTGDAVLPGFSASVAEVFARLDG